MFVLQPASRSEKGVGAVSQSGSAGGRLQTAARFLPLCTRLHGDAGPSRQSGGPALSRIGPRAVGRT